MRQRAYSYDIIYSWGEGKTPTKLLEAINMELFKLWSNNKMATFQTESEAHSFANQQDIFDYVVLKLKVEDESTWAIQVKDEEEGWHTEAYLFAGDNGQWSWTEDFYSGYWGDTINQVLKNFVSTKRNKAIDDGERVNSPFDVYSPSELGLTIKF
jgi:hypothetical protein